MTGCLTPHAASMFFWVIPISLLVRRISCTKFCFFSKISSDAFIDFLTSLPKIKFVRAANRPAKGPRLHVCFFPPSHMRKLNNIFLFAYQYYPRLLASRQGLRIRIFYILLILQNISATNNIYTDNTTYLVEIEPLLTFFIRI